MPLLRLHKTLPLLAACLGFAGAMACMGLVLPIVNNYLSAEPAVGAAKISTTQPLVRVRFVPPHIAHIRARDGHVVDLVLRADPDCPRPDGWV